MQMAEIYDSSQGLVKIGPCKWSPNLDVAFWLSHNDDTILKVRGVHIISSPGTLIYLIHWSIYLLLFFTQGLRCGP